MVFIRLQSASKFRRRFYELAANRSAPIASEALARIAGLYAYLVDVIIKMANGHLNRQLDELLTWAYKPAQPAIDLT